METILENNEADKTLRSFEEASDEENELHAFSSQQLRKTETAGAHFGAQVTEANAKDISDAWS